MSPVRILAIGDSYMSADVFRTALEARGLEADYATVTIPAGAPAWDTDGIREFEGDPAQVAAMVEGHDLVALHGAPVTARVIAENPGLRMLACARGGPVNIDVAAAEAAGITVTTTPGKNADAVADLTLGFVVQLLRHVPASLRAVDDAVAEGRPVAESTFEGARWFGRELRDLRLGLVGFGHVARLVAQRALALGVRVSTFDPFLRDGGLPGVSVVGSLGELFAGSDAISLHARATAENRGMVSADLLGLLPPGAVFVNTARESLVDEHALLAALRSGRLSGAALDVNEPDGPWRELVALPQVVLTPHIGGATHETLARGASMIAQDLVAFTEGREPAWAR